MSVTNFVSPENIVYKGKEANEIMAKPLMESDLYGYGITYRPGVKGKEQLVSGKIEDGLFQAYSCSFTPNGQVNLTEKWITPENIKINMQECYDKFWPSFMAEETRRAYVGENIPRTFFEWFEGELIKQMKKEYENLFWNGDKSEGLGNLNLIDGIVKQLKDSENSVKVSGSAITVDNILAQIKAVAEKASVDVADEDYKIFINKGQMRVLRTALANEKLTDNLVWSNYAQSGDKIYAYGFEVIGCGIAKDVILLAPAKNLVLGFDLESDQTNFQILDLSQVTGDNEFRVITLCNIAVGLVFDELMVISTVA